MAETAVKDYYDDAIAGEDVGGGDPGIAALMAVVDERDQELPAPTGPATVPDPVIVAAAAASSPAPATPAEAPARLPWLRRLLAGIVRPRG